MNSEVKKNTFFEIFTRLKRLDPILFIMLTVLLFYLFPYVFLPFAWDHDFFVGSAQRYLNGILPYRDIADNNFPGTHLLHMGAMILTRGNSISFRLFDVLFCPNKCFRS